MVGYDLITSTGQSCALLSFVITVGIMFGFGLIQMWGGMGMGDEWDDYYGNTTGVSTAPNASTPIISYVPTATGHRTVLTKGRYADKSSDFDYTWKWIASQGKMGWVQKEPEPTVVVFCSDDLKESVNEILEKNGKIAYK